MNNLKTNRTALVLVLLFILLTLYSLYEARFLIAGPKLIISSPKTKNFETTDPILNIGGKTKNILGLEINGRKVLVTPDGMFKDKLILLNGYNTIDIKVRDRFKRENSQELKILLKESGV